MLRRTYVACSTQPRRASAFPVHLYISLYHQAEKMYQTKMEMFVNVKALARKDSSGEAIVREPTWVAATRITKTGRTDMKRRSETRPVMLSGNQNQTAMTGQ